MTLELGGKGGIESSRSFQAIATENNERSDLWHQLGMASFTGFCSVCVCVCVCVCVFKVSLGAGWDEAIILKSLEILKCFPSLFWKTLFIHLCHFQTKQT